MLILPKTPVRGMLTKANEPCITNADCVPDWEHCQKRSANQTTNNSKTNEQLSELICVHKDQFPMIPLEYLLSFVMLGVSVFTNSGGLGGAGIMVPVMLGFYKFDAKNAIIISNFSAANAALVRYLRCLRESHPLKNGYGVVPDYNIITVILPAAIFGASIGSIVNLILPGPIILVVFILFSIFTMMTALRKYWHLHLTE